MATCEKGWEIPPEPPSQNNPPNKHMDKYN